jgi:hypothetical protein
MPVEQFDLAGNYLDRAAAKSDTDFLLAQLKQVDDMFNKLESRKLSINAASGTKETITATKDAQKATDDLVKSKQKLLDQDLKAARVITENNKARLAEAKAAKESALQILAEAKASAIAEKAKLAETTATEKKAKALQKEADAAAKAAAIEDGGTFIGTSANSGNLSDAEKAAFDAEKKAEDESTNAIFKNTNSETENAKAKRQTKAEIDVLAKAKKQLAFAQSEENVLLQNYKIQSTEASKAAKLEALEGLGLLGAYQKLNIQYDSAQKNAKDLAAEFGINSVQAKSAAAEALKLNAQIKAIDKTVGQSQKNVGNYSSAFGKAFASIRQLAYILPGIGIAGLFNLAFEAIGSLLSKLTIFGSKASEINDQIAESFKKGGDSAIKQAADLKVLYEISQDTNISLAERKKATDELVQINDENNKTTGENNKLLIDSNGLLKQQPDLIDKISDSLIRQAKTKAALNLLEKAYGELIEAQNESLVGSFKNLNLLDQIDVIMNTAGQTIEGVANAVSKTLTKGTTDAMEKITNLKKFLADGLKDGSLSLGGALSTPSEKIKAIDKKFFTDELKDRADQSKKLSEITTLELTTRITARQNAATIEKQIIKGTRDVELQNEIDKLKAVKDKKGATTIEVLNATREFREKEHEINQKANFDLTKIERDTQSDLLTIRQQYAGRQKELDKADNEATRKAFDEDSKKRIETVLKQQERSQAALADGKDIEVAHLNKTYEARIASANGNEKKITKITEQYTTERAQIEFSYADAILKSEIDTAEKVLAINKAAGLDTTKEEKQIADLKISLNDLETKNFIDNTERKRKKHKEFLADIATDIEKIKGFSDQVGGVIGGAIDALTIAEKNRLQEQSDGIDKNKQQEIEAINATAASSQEKADKIALVEARAQAQKDQIAIKERQADERKARFDKAQAVANIALNTALAVIHQLATGDPLTAFARAIAVGAIGAAELAVAIATPIPKYKHGTPNHPGGRAELGDGGKSEFVILPDGTAFTTPSKSTLYDLPKGTRVLPDADRVLNKSLLLAMKGLPDSPMSADGYGYQVAASIEREMRATRAVIKNKREIHIHGTAGGVTALHQWAQSRINYVEDNMRFK